MRNTRRSVIGLFVPLVVYIFSGASAGTSALCEFNFSECPEQFNNDTIIVPKDVVAMSARVRACGALLSTQQADSSPVSIMFVIDNSGSMSGNSPTDQANDRWGARFTVTSELLDTIYKSMPSAEVGVAVFTNHLYFDKTSPQYFAQYFMALPQVYDSQPDQSYLELLTLNKNYGGRTGISIIKDVLATDTVDQGTNPHLGLVYQPRFAVTDYTNINIGFEAVRQAMKQSASPANRQFTIFLSDGEPNGPDQAGENPLDFTKGTGMPTTFTVFFTQNANPPASLTTMTTNIQNNGYSSSNPLSALWTLSANHDALLQMLSQSVVSKIDVSGKPSTMTVNTISSNLLADSSFVFPQFFALNSGFTNYNISITYTYTDPVTNLAHDTVSHVSFVVRRDTSSAVSPGIALACQEQSQLQFFYDGAPVSVLRSDNNPVEIRLVPWDTSLTSARVTITTSIDTETLTLTRSGNYLSTQFVHRSQATGVNNNGTVEHIPADLLQAVYSNPVIAADTAQATVGTLQVIPSNVSVSMAPNPFNPRSELPENVQQYYQGILNNEKTGIIIAIKSTYALKAIEGSDFGTATILDAVGNIVRKDLAVKQVSIGNDNEYGIFWDGTNSTGRYVGAGTYLVVIRVTDANNTVSSRRVKVGVKR